MAFETVCNTKCIVCTGGHFVLNVVLTSYRINELANLMYLPRAQVARETLIEDRTKAHADHVGHGPDRMTTAAVGVLKAVHAGTP